MLSMNQRSAEVKQAALADLHSQLADLDAEIVRIERQLGDLRAQYRVPERRAMTAVHRGDDRAAKAALEKVRQIVETIAPLEADLKVLQAMTTEYRRALDHLE
jgi:phage shock protein A